MAANAKYIHTKLHLSDSQRKSIAKALSGGSGVSLKFTHKHLQLPENADVLLTKTQHDKLERVYKAEKGLTLKLSKSQLNAMKTGGFLPQILGALVGSLAPMLFSRIFPDKNQEGNGILL